MVNYNITDRWMKGIDHHPKSEALYKRIADLDFKYQSDSLGLRSGGDGDNGEALMFLLDIIFEEDEQS